MKVNVLINNNKAEFDVDPTHPLETLKLLIYEKALREVTFPSTTEPGARQHVHHNQIRLLCRGKQIPKDNTLDEFGVFEGDTLLLYVCPSSNPGEEQDDEKEVVFGGGKLSYTITLSQRGAIKTGSPEDHEKLSDEEVEGLLRRLPVELPAEDALNPAEVFKKEEPRPDNEKDIVLCDAFPVITPLEAVVATNSKQTPLRVDNVYPEGKVFSAAKISVKFSQPMIPLSSFEEVNKTFPVPVSITPKIENGSWKWIDPFMAHFQLDGDVEFPKSSKYLCEVAAGVVSAIGGELAVAKTWKFTAGTLQMTQHKVSFAGKYTQCGVEFNQPINIAAFYDAMVVSADNSLCDAELVKDPSKIHHALLKYWPVEEEGHKRCSFVLEVKEELPPASKVEVVFADGIVFSVGTPFTQKQLKTKKPYKISFSTPSPLSVVATTFTESTHFTILFNNSLSPTIVMDKVEAIKQYIRVVPEIPMMTVSVDGSSLSIKGEIKYQKEYNVFLATSFVDIYGQYLDKETRVTKVLPAPTHSSLQPACEYGSFMSSYIACLDPHNPPVFHFTSQNVRAVEVYAYSITNAAQWGSWKTFTESTDRKSWLTCVYKTVVPVASEEQLYTNVYTAINLEKAFGCDDSLECGRSRHSILGLVVIAVENPFTGVLKKNQKPPQPPCYKMGLVWSDIGASFFMDDTSFYGWALSLTTGKPINGCEITINNIKDNDHVYNGKTNKDGIVKINDFALGKADFLFAKSGNATTIVSIQKGLYSTPTKEKHVWYILDDRGIYRPTDKVNIKGVLRWIDLSNGKITYTKDTTQASDSDDDDESMDLFGTDDDVGDDYVEYDVKDSRSKVVKAATKTALTASNTFDFSFELPETINLGSVVITLRYKGKKWEHTHTVQVQEFKKPEFVASMTKDVSNVITQGEPFHFSAHALAYSGEVVGNTTAEWNIQVDKALYNPPQLGSFNFGMAGGSDAYDPGCRWISGKTHSGKHHIAVAVTNINCPLSLNATCTLKDANNQNSSAKSFLVVHPTSVYVGVKTDVAFGNLGDAIVVRVVTCTPEGAFTNNCALRMYVHGTHFASMEECPKEVEVCNVEVAPSDAGPVDCFFTPTFRGEHKVTLVATDLQGRQISASLVVWVYGPQSATEKEYELWAVRKSSQPINPNPMRPLKTSKFSAVFDRSDAYPVGSTATLLLTGGFSTCRGMLAIHKGHTIVHTQNFVVTDEMAVLQIPITEDFVPGAQCFVQLAGSKLRQYDEDDASFDAKTDDSKNANPPAKKAKLGKSQPEYEPAYATQNLFLRVSKDHKQLLVNVRPSHEFSAPGNKVDVDVDVAFGDDKAPLGNTELAIAVVDEAVLALAGYKLVNPIETFYQDSNSSLAAVGSGYSNVVLSNSRPVKPPAKIDMVLTVMYLSGRVLRFECGNTITVAQLKGLIQDRDGIPPHMQRITFKGKQLEEGYNLLDYGVPNGATLHLTMRLFGGGDTGKGDDEDTDPVVRLRIDMKPVAYFSPFSKTDASGKAKFSFDLPDSLTKYRVMVVANTMDMFGAGEASITSSLPLMVKQSPPRFLNYGDECTFNVSVQNEALDPREVRVAMRAVNTNIAVRGYKIQLAARSRASIPFTVKPTRCGQCKFQVIAVSNGSAESDAAQFEFPVLSPVTSETFAHTAHLDGDGVVRQPLALPNEIASNFGGVTITTACTAFTELTDAAMYTMDYPYECTEQISSRLMTLAAIKDALAAFNHPSLPNPEELKVKVNSLIATLSERQSQGEFGYWQKLGKSYTYVNVYAYFALAKLAEKGFDVPENLKKEGIKYLNKQVDKLKVEPEDTEEDDQGKIWEYEYNAAYVCLALYVLNMWGARNEDKAKEMIKRKKFQYLPMDQIAWLLPTLTDNQPVLAKKFKKLYKHINNSIVQTPTTAHFQNSYSNADGTVFLNSKIREAAVALDVLIQTDPSHTAIPKLVRGLLQSRKKNIWYNTQDNVYALIALDRYFQRYENIEPSFIVDMWIGKGYVGRAQYQGYTTENKGFKVPMKAIVGHNDNVSKGDVVDNSLLVAKRGQGRLYYRMALQYAPLELFLPPVDNGFRITREYSFLDHKDDVVEKTMEGEEGKRKRRLFFIKAGSRVSVTVKMVTSSTRCHIALLDYLPGGLEALNPALDPAGKKTYSRWQWQRVWTHTNFRDSRVEAFAEKVYGGTYEYVYTARAVTVGKYVAPPAKAEEMYSPEVYGRSDMVLVEVMKQ